MDMLREVLVLLDSTVMDLPIFLDISKPNRTVISYTVLGKPFKAEFARTEPVRTPHFSCRVELTDHPMLHDPSMEMNLYFKINSRNRILEQYMSQLVVKILDPMAKTVDITVRDQNPVIARDPEFGPVRLRAFGTYAIRIKDPAVFLREVVGTDGHFTVDEISDQLRNIIVARFGTIVASSGIPMLDLAANYDQLGQFVLGRIAPEFANYGLELTTILLENVSLPPEVEQALDRRTSMGVVGDLSKYTQFQAAEAMRAAASNPGAAGQAVGMMVGMGVGQQASPWGARPAEPAAAPPPPPPPPAAAYHVAVDGKATGPFGLDQLRQQLAGGAFTTASLVWAPGMAGWLAAGEVGELKPLFAAVPPPVPGGA